MSKCFVCIKGNVDNKGLCDNPECPRNKPLNPPKEKENEIKEENK